MRNGSCVTDRIGGKSEGEIFGFELLWVPDDDDESLEMDEVYIDWPELITC